MTFFKERITRFKYNIYKGFSKTQSRKRFLLDSIKTKRIYLKADRAGKKGGNGCVAATFSIFIFIKERFIGCLNQQAF